jgi:hypothetical protein
LSTLPPDIKQAVADAAKEFHKVDNFITPEHTFVDGAEWLFDYLSKAAPEFDEGAAQQVRIERSYNTLFGIMKDTGENARIGFVDGARWQHSQDAARIARAEMWSRADRSLMETHKANAQAMCDKLTAAEAKLAVAVEALELIAGARCAWQLSQSIAREALEKIKGP